MIRHSDPCSRLMTSLEEGHTLAEVDLPGRLTASQVPPAQRPGPQRRAEAPATGSACWAALSRSRFRNGSPSSCDASHASSSSSIMPSIWAETLSRIDRIMATPRFSFQLSKGHLRENSRLMEYHGESHQESVVFILFLIIGFITVASRKVSRLVIQILKGHVIIEALPVLRQTPFDPLLLPFVLRPNTRDYWLANRSHGVVKPEQPSLGLLLVRQIVEENFDAREACPDRGGPKKLDHDFRSRSW